MKVGLQIVQIARFLQQLQKYSQQCPAKWLRTRVPHTELHLYQLTKTKAVPAIQEAIRNQMGLDPSISTMCNTHTGKCSFFTLEFLETSFTMAQQNTPFLTGQYLCVDTDMGFWSAGKKPCRSLEDTFLLTLRCDCILPTSYQKLSRPLHYLL